MVNQSCGELPIGKLLEERNPGSDGDLRHGLKWILTGKMIPIDASLRRPSGRRVGMRGGAGRHRSENKSSRIRGRLCACAAGFLFFFFHPVEQDADEFQFRRGVGGIVNYGEDGVDTSFLRSGAQLRDSLGNLLLDDVYFSFVYLGKDQ